MMTVITASTGERHEILTTEELQQRYDEATARFVAASEQYHGLKTEEAWEAAKSAHHQTHVAYRRLVARYKATETSLLNAMDVLTDEQSAEEEAAADRLILIDRGFFEADDSVPSDPWIEDAELARADEIADAFAFELQERW